MSEGDNSSEARRRAVALAYSGGRTDAPIVVAKGYGNVAERIIELATQEGVFVHDSPELVSLLMQVDLDARIPESLYQVIAELLVWVGQIDQSMAPLQSEPSSDPSPGMSPGV